MEQKRYVSLGLLRIALGWVFLWAFLDKLFGLGFSTAADKSWLNGVSPTDGFLKFATKGPFAAWFQGLAGSPVIDWLFMAGLLGIGGALMLGIGMRLATYAGVLMLSLMFVAGFLPPEHNPVLDEHVVYALALISLYRVDAGSSLGLGRWWRSTALVRRYPIFG